MPYCLPESCWSDSTLHSLTHNRAQAALVSRHYPPLNRRDICSPYICLFRGLGDKTVDSCLLGTDAEVQARPIFLPDLFRLLSECAATAIAKNFSAPPKISFSLICVTSAEYEHLMLSLLYIPGALSTTTSLLNLSSSYTAPHCFCS